MEVAEGLKGRKNKRDLFTPPSPLGVSLLCTSYTASASVVACCDSSYSFKKGEPQMEVVVGRDHSWAWGKTERNKHPQPPNPHPRRPKK